jgi:hypothetical protein
VLGWICTIKLSWAVLASEIKENSFAGINTWEPNFWVWPFEFDHPSLFCTN